MNFIQGNDQSTVCGTPTRPPPLQDVRAYHCLCHGKPFKATTQPTLPLTLVNKTRRSEWNVKYWIYVHGFPGVSSSQGYFVLTISEEA